MEYLRERRRVPSKLRGDEEERRERRRRRRRWMEVIIVSWSKEKHSYFMSKKNMGRVIG